MKAQRIPKENLEKARSCFECGICTGSCPMAQLMSTEYNPRSLLQRVLLEPEKALREESLWLCAWCYKCYQLCPQGLKPPEMFQQLKVEAVKHGFLNGFEEAVSAMKNKVPFPVVCWHTCFHPERSGVSKEKLAEALNTLNIPKSRIKGEEANQDFRVKVAIVGSGPAGLSAASELVKAGYSVTVFEALPQVGGMLRKCMPQYRLPRKVLENEVQHLKRLGIEFKVNTSVGKDVDFEDLRRAGFKAIFVAVGAHKSRKLGVEGEDLEGVVDALDFLWKVNCQDTISIGRKVAVVGGGNVAVDAARTALGNGAQEVSILYRRGREEMPANPWEILEAENSGVKLTFQVAPTRIFGKNGRVTGLECVKTKLGEPDETGRRKPVPVEDSKFTLKFDTVIVAIGETVDTSFLPKEVKVEGNRRVLVNPISLETTLKGVFAGGDAVTGPATVVEAILAGRQAAQSITEYLSNRTTGGKQIGT